MVKPNILILYIDQQRFDTIAAYGNSHMITPNLDRLAASGCRFSNSYSSSPACMPTRHDLLTGLSARHHGYWTNGKKTMSDLKDYKTMPQLLNECGYETIAIGKMHHYPAREHHGWSSMQLMEEIPVSLEEDEYLQYLQAAGYENVMSPHGVRSLFYHSPQAAPIPEKHLGTCWVADNIIKTMREKREKPFCIMGGWIDPHPPYSVPQKYLDMYRDAELPPPCPRPDGDSRQYPFDENNYPDKLHLQRLREAYFAACTFVDEQIGRVLDFLETNNMLSDTVIIFTSDHGEMLGDRQAFQKFTPYEGSARVPLIISGPGFAPGSSCDVPVVSWDLTATVLDIAGAAPPPEQPYAGTGLRKILTEQDKFANRIICFHHGGDPDAPASPFKRFVAAVGHGFKFIHYYNGGDEELYDLQNDPDEQSNLISGNPACQAVLMELRRACIDFERQHGQPELINADSGFIDDEYHKPLFNVAGFFGARIKQIPRWPGKIGKTERTHLLRELYDGLNMESVCIPGHANLEDELRSVWQELGGENEDMNEFISAMRKKLAGEKE